LFHPCIQRLEAPNRDHLKRIIKQTTGGCYFSAYAAQCAALSLTTGGSVGLASLERSKPMNRYRLFQKHSRGGNYYLHDNQTGLQQSLHRNDKTTARRLLNAHNEAACLLAIHRQIAHAYLRITDPKMAQRIWQNLMAFVADQKRGATRERWERAINDRAFDSLRTRPLIETSAEELLMVLKQGKVSTNVYLRRLHNFALDCDWLLKPILPKRQWPKIIHRKARAIQSSEHIQIIAREKNAERRAFTNCFGIWAARNQTWRFSRRRMWTGKSRQSPTRARSFKIAEPTRPPSASSPTWRKSFRDFQRRVRCSRICGPCERVTGRRNLSSVAKDWLSGA
jgi:hypothetical protein